MTTTTPSPNRQQPTRDQVLEEHLRAENAHDLDAIMDTFASDARLVLNGRSFDRFDTIRELHDDFGFGLDRGFSALRVTERRRYACEEAIIMEQSLSGNHTRTWNGIAASGRAFNIPVCTVYTFDESHLIVEERVYFDMLCLLRQVGATFPPEW